MVTSRSVEEGQTVASGFETPTLFTIAADLTKMEVVADVDEADIANVKEGDFVVFRVDAYPNDEFLGEVKQVRLGSTISEKTTTSTNTVVTYEVVISAENPDLKLKPRLTANASIYTFFKNDVLIVPSKALYFTPNPELLKDYTIVDTKAPHKVWTLKDKELKAIPVEIGLTDGINTEIISGLNEGDNIVSDIIFEDIDSPMGGGSQERSPFMPQHPGSKKKK